MEMMNFLMLYRMMMMMKRSPNALLECLSMRESEPAHHRMVNPANEEVVKPKPEVENR
jgi:hypothetical protein